MATTEESAVKGGSGVDGFRVFLSLILITNTDDDIIRETEKTIGVKFDEIVTAQQAGAYKPSHKGFHLARERLGLPGMEMDQL